MGVYIFKTNINGKAVNQSKSYDANAKIIAEAQDYQQKTSDVAVNTQKRCVSKSGSPQENPSSHNLKIKRGANITRNVAVDPEIYFLPLLAGVGLVDDLDIAMSKDLF